MEKQNKIIFIIILVITISVIVLCGYSVFKNKDREIEDSIKFRDEYMELNGKLNELTNSNYIDVLLSDNNTFKYKSSKEIVKILDSKTGIIYFGNPTNTMSRLLVPILDNLGKEYKENIYYLNISEISTSFILSSGKINKVQKGSDEYYKILKSLDKYLSDFELQDEEGNVYNAKEKRIIIPTVIAINNGKISGFYENKIDELQYDTLNKEEIEKSLRDLFDSIEVEVCTKDGC